jgi:hypothetical protein
VQYKNLVTGLRMGGKEVCPRYGFVQTITFEFQQARGGGLVQRWIIQDDEAHLEELAELYGYGYGGTSSILYGRFADMSLEE